MSDGIVFGAGFLVPGSPAWDLLSEEHQRQIGVENEQRERDLKVARHVAAGEAAALAGQ